MIAVIELKGKQFRVEPEHIIRCLRINGEPGERIEVERVLTLIDGDNVRIGQPLVEGAKVGLEIVRQSKSPKINIFTYQARKRVQRRKGYRDEITYLRVKDIRG